MCRRACPIASSTRLSFFASRGPLAISCTLADPFISVGDVRAPVASLETVAGHLIVCRYESETKFPGRRSRRVGLHCTQCFRHRIESTRVAAAAPTGVSLKFFLLDGQADDFHARLPSAGELVTCYSIRALFTETVFRDEGWECCGRVTWWPTWRQRPTKQVNVMTAIRLQWKLSDVFLQHTEACS